MIDYPSNLPSCGGPTSYKILFGFLRQDDKKIYQYDGIYGDTLLYDFDLHLGDTVPETFHNFNQGLIVTAVDSLLVGTSYRKAFTLNNNVNKRLTEGLGNFGGLIFPHAPGAINYTSDFAFHYSIHNINYYPSMASGNCYSYLSIDEVEDQDVIAYPNPSSGKIRIKTGSRAAQLEVISSTGQYITLDFQSGDEEVEVDLSNLSSGIYLLRIENQEGKTTVLRVVKE